MKILIDFQDTIGGAPRSLKEHALLLKEEGHEIIAIMSERDYGNFFDASGFEIVIIPRFFTKYIFKNIKLIFSYWKLVRAKNINLIYTNRVLQCQFLSIVSDLSSVPILNARAGGYITSDIIKIQKDKHYIVFSEENLEAFQKAGFPSKNIFLLRNRIPTPKMNSILENTKENGIVITITGSVKKDTLTGLLWFFSFLQKQSFKSDIDYQINIAGGNILKEKNEILKFEQELFNTNRILPQNCKITHLGWVEDIIQLQSNSHICIGKGRSIIQPAMNGKICFVISERGTIYRCKKDSYNDLMFYNFSGRGIIEEELSSLIEFKEILNCENTFKKCQEDAHELTLQFKQDYSIDHAKEKLKKIIDTVIIDQNLKVFNGIIKFFHIYFYTLKEIVNKKIKLFY